MTTSTVAADQMRYYVLPRYWTTKRVVPHLDNPELQANLVRDFNKFTWGRWRQRFQPGESGAFTTGLGAPDADLSPTAFDAITFASSAIGIDQQRDLLVVLIGDASDDAESPRRIAAGPLEGFLCRFDDEPINRVKSEAARDSPFERVFTGHRHTELPVSVCDSYEVITRSGVAALATRPALGSLAAPPATAGRRWERQGKAE